MCLAGVHLKGVGTVAAGAATHFSCQLLFFLAVALEPPNEMTDTYMHSSRTPDALGVLAESVASTFNAVSFPYPK